MQKFEEIASNHGGEEVEGYNAYRNIEKFGEVIKELLVMREDIESEEEFEKTSGIIEGFLKEMQIIIKEDNFTINRLENYEVYGNNIEGSVASNDR